LALVSTEVGLAPLSPKRGEGSQDFRVEANAY
jgi:hypothetical protein